MPTDLDNLLDNNRRWAAATEAREWFKTMASASAQLTNRSLEYCSKQSHDLGGFEKEPMMVRTVRSDSRTK